MAVDFVKKIWLPDTFVVNSRETKSHISTNTETNSKLRIKPSGEMNYGIRQTVTVMCPMDLRYYPMDSQTCQLVFSSYNYDNQSVEYFWRTDFEEDLKVTQIALANFVLSKSKLSKNVTTYQEDDNFSYLVIEVLLVRRLSNYINQVYIPAILIVIISWIPFWLDRKDTHARVALGVTTVLTMTTLVTQTNSVMPKISYLNALDIYLQFSFSMVFLSLIQYAIVCYFTIKVEKRNTKSHDSRQEISKQSVKNLIIMLKHHPNKIDWYFRRIFPSSFFIFNSFYWIIYICLSILVEFVR